MTSPPRAPGALTLEEGLAHFAQDAWAGVELDVDLKAPGYELRVLEALRDHGLLDRVLVSTMERDSLRILRAHAPEVRLGWSVPKMRRNSARQPGHARAGARGAQVARQALPGQAAQALRSGEVDALMSHWAFVTPRLARAVRGPAASSTCGPSTTRRASPRSSASASPGSSRTTRGSSAHDLAHPHATP